MTPRVFGIVATAAPTVAIIRRGPSDWVHVGAWHLDDDAYEPGAWFHGVIYPQKCDLSPDGRWFVYSAMKQSADWPAGNVYEAVSRLPWLTALAAWGSGTTYTRGMHFTSDHQDPGSPDVGDAGPAVRRYGLAWKKPIQFAVEQERGWTEAPGTPPRASGGAWDEARSVTMVRVQPGGAAMLQVSGRYAAFRTGDPTDGPPRYQLVGDDVPEPLDGVQWADWAPNGDLLVATGDGRLERRSQTEQWLVADLGALEPEPLPPPDWAGVW